MKKDQWLPVAEEYWKVDSLPRTFTETKGGRVYTDHLDLVLVARSVRTDSKVELTNYRGETKTHQSSGHFRKLPTAPPRWLRRLVQPINWLIEAVDWLLTHSERRS